MPRKFFKKISPSADTIKKQKSLNFLGKALHSPVLWHLNRRSVSLAFAIGLFMMWVPFPPQMLFAALTAIFFRANVPISIALVWITNPITIPPMFYFAYWLGNKLLSREVENFNFELNWEWFTTGLLQVWQPLLFGSLILGIISSILGYVSIHLLWRYNIKRRWEERRERRKLRKQQKKK
jgi:uncharacterized protein (DUF2062 family)